MSLAVPFPWKFGTAFQASNSVPGCFLRLSNWASSRCGSRSCPKEPVRLASIVSSLLSGLSRICSRGQYFCWNLSRARDRHKTWPKCMLAEIFAGHLDLITHLDQARTHPFANPITEGLFTD